MEEFLERAELNIQKSGRDNGISTDEKLMRSAVVCFTKVMVDCDLKRKQAMAVAG